LPREWWESDVFDLQLAEVLFDSPRLKLAKTEVKNLIRLSRLKKGGMVLDAACGVGRHSLDFARLGYEVCGVDASPAYVAQARRMAKKEGLKKARFEKGELRDLYRFQNSCDLVINLYNSFGYYASERDNLEALSQMASALKPGGSLVLDLIPRESIEVNFKERDWRPTAGGGYLMEKRTWAGQGRRLLNEWILALDGHLREIHWDLRLYSVDELKAMFRRLGLRHLRAMRDFKGNPWKLGWPLVLIGQK
jgi:SAM-dependent methyltransferase